MAKKKRILKKTPDNAGFSLANLLDFAGKEMSARLRARLVPHKAELGFSREEVVRSFLRAYLPKRFDVSHGFAFDCTGAVSRQLDVIVSDAGVAPMFEGPGGTRFVPCEAIVAAGQVKSVLRSRSEYLAALANLESAKALDRSAAGRAFDRKHGEALDHQQNHLHQIFTFLLITGGALKGEHAQEEFWEHSMQTPSHVWTNVVLAMDKYILTFCCDAGVCPNPMDARGLALQPAGSQDDLLMRFYILLGGAIEVTRVSGFPYWEYLESARKWSARLLFAVTPQNPPPLMGSITHGWPEE